MASFWKKSSSDKFLTGTISAMEIWKVYAPYDLFNQSEAYLIGHVTGNSQSIYITATSNNISTETQISNLELLGIWTTEESNVNKGRHVKRKHEFWVNLWNNKSGDLLCEVCIDGNIHECISLIYNPSELLQSEILKQKVEIFEDFGTITSLVRVLHDTNQSLSEYEDGGVVTVYTRVSRHSYFRAKLLQCLVFILCLLYLPFQLFAEDTKREITHGKGIKHKGFGVSATVAQLGVRIRDLLQLKSSKDHPPFSVSRSWNTCIKQMTDTALGLVLMYYLMSGNMAQSFANFSISYGDRVAGELKVLLDWLMGAPAGLKLNSQLTHILGKFFQYHIYLWSGYLYILKPVLGQLIYYSSIAGVWGVSVQLALFQDILSTMTVHIYCFYVYAARLYRLQMYAMASLWRLFRGKKWNVLRQRVDSAMYDADQLFVGTLLFTVLLFILPTTGLYYVVFTLLRVVVLTVQGVVSRLRQLLNDIPWWYMILWVLKSPSLTDGAVFQCVSDTGKTQSTLILSLKATRPTLSEILCMTRKPVVASATYSWATIIQNLFLGHLIYPWIEKKKD